MVVTRTLYNSNPPVLENKMAINVNNLSGLLVSSVCYAFGCAL